MENLSDRSSFFTSRLIAIPVGDIRYCQHQHNAHQNARQVSGHKHIKYGVFCNRRIQNQHNSWRDHGRDQRRRRGNSGRERSVKAPLFHFRHQHFALHCSIRVGGTAQSAHERGQQHIYLRQTAPHMAHTEIRKLHHARGNTGIIHQQPRCDKKWDRH